VSTRFGKVLENFGKLPTEQKPRAEQPNPVTRKVGRPPGKKSSPDYTQVVIYLRKEVHLTAKKMLLDEQREFSELVNELVAQWI
jgi:hypothetical protein